jgi:hypothetical protein
LAGRSTKLPRHNATPISSPIDPDKDHAISGCPGTTSSATFVTVCRAGVWSTRHACANSQEGARQLGKDASCG